ncbi:site-specific integrase [Streptomyces sp. NBC_01618]|uniref:site-specific integrase n=1 Tax=Streptomyces sp. NBC_01618 TaxID=2975900 RepID=UPI00386C13E9
MPVQRIELGDRRTWTVVGSDYLPIVPVEEFLEFLRVGRDALPHTLRSYAASLNVWWDYLEAAGLAWDERTAPSGACARSHWTSAPSCTTGSARRRAAPRSAARSSRERSTRTCRRSTCSTGS